MNNDQLDAVLLQDILQAYHDAGGVNCFLKDEKLLEAVLLKLFAQPTPPPAVVIDLSIHAPWINWSNRLQYKTAPLELVQDAPSERPIEQRPTIIEEGSWKDAPPQRGLAHILREDAKAKP